MTIFAVLFAAATQVMVTTPARFVLMINLITISFQYAVKPHERSVYISAEMPIR